MIHLTALFADAPLPDPTTLSSPSSIHNDPSIDHSGQLIIYVGIALLGLGITAVVGFFSRRVEYALVTALVFSLCLVALFAFVR